MTAKAVTQPASFVRNFKTSNCEVKQSDIGYEQAPVAVWAGDQEVVHEGHFDYIFHHRGDSRRNGVNHRKTRYYDGEKL